MNKIRVLVIDDSAVFREIIKRGLETDPNIKVVGTAMDPFDARDKILDLHPDVVTCDIEMPRMDGIEFVKRLLPQYPIPVIVVSSISERVFDAMEAGAVDFITKPNAASVDDVKDFIGLLTSKVRGTKTANISQDKQKTIENKNKTNDYHQLIAIGASTGGTEAIFSLLKQLPNDLPGIVIVQHIPPVFSKMFAERLNKQTHFSVKEAEHGDVIKRNHVYLAPGDKHMKIDKMGSQLKLQVFTGEKVSGHCPSVDVLFTSVAKSLGDRSLGVILTGMGYDGAKGITMMKRKGAVTIGQDEASCVVYGMPKAAFELGGIKKQASLELMGYQIMKFLR